MQNIQIVIGNNIHNLGGKGSIVGRVFKERVVVAVHLVVKYICLEMRQPDRSPVCDEVYLVPLAGETQTQFGGYYSGAAISGVTNDTYFHA